MYGAPLTLQELRNRLDGLASSIYIVLCGYPSKVHDAVAWHSDRPGEHLEEKLVHARDYFRDKFTTTSGNATVAHLGNWTRDDSLRFSVFIACVLVPEFDGAKIDLREEWPWQCGTRRIRAEDRVAEIIIPGRVHAATWLLEGPCHLPDDDDPLATNTEACNRLGVFLAMAERSLSELERLTSAPGSTYASTDSTARDVDVLLTEDQEIVLSALFQLGRIARQREVEDTLRRMGTPRGIKKIRGTLKELRETGFVYRPHGEGSRKGDVLSPAGRLACESIRKRQRRSAY